MSDDDDGDEDWGEPHNKNSSSGVTSHFAARLASLSGAAGAGGGGVSTPSYATSRQSNAVDELLVNESDEEADFDSLRGEILSEAQTPADKKPLVVSMLYGLSDRTNAVRRRSLLATIEPCPQFMLHS